MISADYRELERTPWLPVDGGVAVGDFPHVRQLLKARQATQFWPKGGARRNDEAHSAEAVRTALR